jgi:eukaryotic-like serine/threonine-protein kinase
MRRDVRICAEPRSHVSALQISTLSEGVILGRYRLTKQLGSGAFGTVWAARDERLDRDVAVKVLPRSRVIHQRFEREARAAARLQHPAIVTLYEAAVDDEGAYLVSELVRGRTLDQALAAGKLSDREIIEIGISLCEALEHAHDQGVIHRDVKPSNILVANRSSNVAGRAKLTDFGVAHVVGGDTLTRTGDVIGTLAYMAPEQAEGREVTPSADLYSLALVLYEALSGVNPLNDAPRHTLRTRRLGTFIPPLRRQRRDLPRDLGAGIDLALSARVGERGSLQDLRAALAGALAGADDTRGVVSGWHGYEETEVEAQPGAEWDEQLDADGTPRPRVARDPTLVAGRSRADRRAPSGWVGARPAVGTPEWLPRAISALGAGLSASWLSAHLLTQAPLAPAAIALIAAALTLLLPRLGWLATVAAVTVLAAGEGRTGGAALWLLVAVPPIALLTLKDGWSAPGLAPALGVIGLAGAFPAVAARAGRSWWQRAVIAAGGYVWLIAAGTLSGHNLFWLPFKPPAADAWLGSPDAMFNQVLVPLAHARGLAGALVWAAAAALAPLLATRRWPTLDLLLAVGWGALTISALAAVGADPLRDPITGTGVAVLVLGWPAAATLIRELRYGAGNATVVA